MMRWQRPTHPLQLIWGLLIWSAWFVLIYAAQALSCTRPTAQALSGITALNGMLLIAGLVLAAALVALMWRCVRATRVPRLPATERFIALAAAVLHGSAAFSVLFVAVPLWSLPPCL